jgi:copper homeostasis protein CutC
MAPGNIVIVTTDISSVVKAGMQGIVLNVMSSGALRVKITHGLHCEAKNLFLPYMPAYFFTLGQNCP